MPMKRPEVLLEAFQAHFLGPLDWTPHASASASAEAGFAALRAAADASTTSFESGKNFRDSMPCSRPAHFAGCHHLLGPSMCMQLLKFGTSPRTAELPGAPRLVHQAPLRLQEGSPAWPPPQRAWSSDGPGLWLRRPPTPPTQCPCGPLPSAACPCCWVAHRASLLTWPAEVPLFAPHHREGATRETSMELPRPAALPSRRPWVRWTSARSGRSAPLCTWQSLGCPSKCAAPWGSIFARAPPRRRGPSPAPRHRSWRPAQWTSSDACQAKQKSNLSFPNSNEMHFYNNPFSIFTRNFKVNLTCLPTIYMPTCTCTQHVGSRTDQALSVFHQPSGLVFSTSDGPQTLCVRVRRLPTLPPHFWGQASFLWPGERQCWHLRARFTFPLHSPPTCTSAQGPFPCQLKQISAPPLSFALPFDEPFPPGCPWPPEALLNFCNSSLSSCILFFLAVLLSGLDCLFFSTSSLGVSMASAPPSKWVAAMVSDGARGAPFPPDASQAAAGCHTCSDQKVSSLARALKHSDHGLSASQSGGVVLPASWSATSPRLIFSNFSALPLSSACAINPQAWGQCKVSLSTVFSYCCKAARDTVLREIAATLKTLQQANHCRKFWRPGSFFIKNWPFPSGANVRNLNSGCAEHGDQKGSRHWSRSMVPDWAPRSSCGGHPTESLWPPSRLPQAPTRSWNQPGLVRLIQQWGHLQDVLLDARTLLGWVHGHLPCSLSLILLDPGPNVNEVPFQSPVLQINSLSSYSPNQPHLRGIDRIEMGAVRKRSMSARLGYDEIRQGGHVLDVCARAANLGTEGCPDGPRYSHQRQQALQVVHGQQVTRGRQQCHARVTQT